MKINCEDIVNALNEGGENAYASLNELVRCIRQIQENWRDRNYVEVRVFSRIGDITSRLRREFPKYEIRWEGNPGCCGENIMLVPGDEWNDSLKDRISKFDDDVGHHQETRQDWKLREDVELPYDLKNEIDQMKANLEKNGKPVTPFVLPGYAKRNYPFDMHSNDWDRYFVETTTVLREWDVPLQVNDRREFVREDEGMKAKTIEI